MDPAVASRSAAGSRPASAAGSKVQGRFGDALAAARRHAASVPKEAPLTGAAGLVHAAVIPGARGRGPDRGRQPTELERPDAEAALQPQPVCQSLADGAAGAASPLEELRAAVRALPAAVEAARLREGAQLTLGFGGALGVELRAGAHGLEVTLNPVPTLSRAAAAELPGLVAALRARGLRVARAEVRPGAAGGARSRRAR